MHNYRILTLGMHEAIDYIKAHHYSRGCHNACKPCYGLFDADNLVGAIVFSNPAVDYTSRMFFGEEHKKRIIELSRLYIQDDTPKNTESWFISRALKKLQIDKPHIRGVVSFSDPAHGHIGTIYQATNALYLGRTNRGIYYIDQTGRQRTIRQNGRNILPEEAKELGWQVFEKELKHRYFWIVGPKRERKDWYSKLLLPQYPYPKHANS